MLFVSDPAEGIELASHTASSCQKFAVEIFGFEHPFPSSYWITAVLFVSESAEGVEPAPHSPSSCQKFAVQVVGFEHLFP